jgi:AcrR family transcriptional regulator
MSVKQERAAQAESTRSALLHHARRLFAQNGYAEASTDEVVRRAKVTKGALYHHFANKQELYRAVVEDMERQLVSVMETAAAAEPDLARRLEAVCRAYLDACLDSSLTRILVLEAPVVLGWKGWCNLAHEYEIAAIAAHLRNAVEAGAVRGQPLDTMAHLLLGALNTAARVIATADDPKAARIQVEDAIARMLNGLASGDLRV